VRVLVFTAHTNWKPHYETDLELIQRHLDKGDEVVHLHCDTELLACDANPNHDLDICRECTAIRKAGISLLQPRVPSISFLNLSQSNEQELGYVQKSFASIAELKNFCIEEFDIGMAVLSSIISLTRDPEPDLSAFSDTVSRFLAAALSIYRSVQNYLEENPVDRVYVFNGRFAPVRAVLRACQSRGVPCYVHERGHDIHHYAVEKNTTTHDLKYMQQQIRKQWEHAAGDSRRKQIAAEFYLDRSKGVVQSWYSYVDRQKEGLLPASWNPAKKNVAIFNSSEDEYAATNAQWNNPLYANQLDGLQKIVRSLEADHDNIHIYLRLHPNLKGVDNKHTRELYNLRRDFFKIIAPDDPVSTYALIKHADKVLTFGSTVGIEAVFWGTPSILVGRSYYQNLGGTYNPASHEELMGLLKADLYPKEIAAALMYGYYFRTFGIPFKYFQATGVASGQFKGQTILARQPSLSLWKARARKLYGLLASQPMSNWPSGIMALWHNRQQRLHIISRLLHLYQ
jgi:Capsule polysaccharide biosynthesis protein